MGATHFVDNLRARKFRPRVGGFFPELLPNFSINRALCFHIGYRNLNLKDISGF